MPGEIILDSVRVPVGNFIKFVGVDVDCNVKWKVHIESLENRLNSSMFSINVLRKSVDISTLEMVYFAGFQSIVSYGLVCWENSSYSNSLNRK